MNNKQKIAAGLVTANVVINKMGFAAYIAASRGLAVIAGPVVGAASLGYLAYSNREKISKATNKAITHIKNKMSDDDKGTEGT